MLKKLLRVNTFALLAVTAVMACAPGDARDANMPLEPIIEVAGGSGAGATTYVRIMETPPPSLPLSVSAIIGLLGGVLNLGDHSLMVPSRAVTLPTLFSMSRIPNGYLEVDLLAVRELSGGVLNVGELGFNKPVTVKLSYKNAANVTNPSKLKIMRLMPNGQHEILPSVVDAKKKTVSAKLDHFSRYCMIQD